MDAFLLSYREKYGMDSGCLLCDVLNVDSN